MSNGHAALHLVSEPIATPAPEQSIELEIGRAVAAGAVAIVMGLRDYATEGAISPSTKVWAGAMLGRVSQLHLDHFGEIDFGAVAAREGRRALLDPNRVITVPPAAVDELVGYVIAIADKVAASELAMAN
jgi:hypothetical protein